MSHCLRNVVIVSFIAVFAFPLVGQEDSRWRISPQDINIQMGEDRRLQLLDDSAQELHGAMWSVDEPDKAEIQEEDGRVVLHAKAVGTVRVSAALGGEMRFRDITIWSAVRPIPPGTSNWGTRPIGREIGDLPVVPTGDGPTTFSLEQTASGSTYLRAVADDGIQMWTWRMPEQTHDVELVCGDWLGGALISANQANSYTLYTVGKDGKLRWQHTTAGLRKGLAISTDHLLHLLSQSADGTVTHIMGLDEMSGAQKFDLRLPVSTEGQINVRKEGTRFVCTSSPVSSLSRTIVSRVFVNMDGLAYLAFTENVRNLGTEKCTPGSTVDSGQIHLARDEKLVLWQIRPEGTYRSTVVEATKGKQSLSAPVNAISPTNSIVTDNMNGMLIPVQLSYNTGSQNAPADEFIYRVDQDGEVVYKFPLPKYTGSLHDEVVIGEDDVAFATRGSLLIAFNVRKGEEIWRWYSNTPDIEVFAALANGHCLVQTPTALVEVENADKSKEVFQGKAMMGWQGQIYRKHN
jgi:outer membrane protein assembly factor BamB